MTRAPLAFLAVLWLAVLAGCHRGPAPVSPWFRADLPHLGELDLGGEAAEPATLDLSQAETGFTIPPGTPVNLAADGSLSFTAAAPVSVTGRSSNLAATGPRAYAPPAAPTPSDNADATARLWAWIAAGLGVVGLALGLFKGWPLVRTGGACIVAAAIAVLALHAVPAWVWSIVGVGAVLAIAGPLLWRFRVRDQVEKPTPPPSASIGLAHPAHDHP